MIGGGEGKETGRMTRGSHHHQMGSNQHVTKPQRVGVCVVVTGSSDEKRNVVKQTVGMTDCGV